MDISKPSYDLDAIRKRGAALSLEIAIQQMPLKSDFWKISGLSGDLKWIDDVALLNSIADAYFNIDNVHGCEVRLQDVGTGPGITIAVTVNGQSMPMMNYVGGFVRQTYPPAISAVEAAHCKTLTGGAGAHEYQHPLQMPLIFRSSATSAGSRFFSGVIAVFTLVVAIGAVRFGA